jgi:omega-6 fatty acid desaturase (delta-12 desaturase)
MPAKARMGRRLHDATRPFARESVARSWAHVAATFGLILGLLACAAVAPWWPVRIVASVFGALVMTRGFVLYHDHMHGALLPRSRVARALFRAYAAIALTPPRSWRASHNYHHTHVGRIADSNVGSFPLMTTDMWNAATRRERLAYRITRHPLTILFGYVTIFLVNVTLLPFLRHPRRHWDSVVALAAHGALILAVWLSLGFGAVFFAILLPVGIATALGGYLFYAQHNFRGMRIMPTAEWSHYDAALVSSSYMKMGPLMRWFTGNIGYHHVHHLNPRIPFYRLPEAMEAIPEAQRPQITTLHPRDIVDCFRLALWDPRRGKMVGFREARRGK